MFTVAGPHLMVHLLVCELVHPCYFGIITHVGCQDIKRLVLCCWMWGRVELLVEKVSQVGFYECNTGLRCPNGLFQRTARTV